MKPNLVRLFYYGGSVYVDTAQLVNLKRNQLSVYTNRGNRLCDVLEKQGKNESSTIHRENVFASAELATADYETFWAQAAA
jgi:hypothetical protein